MNLQNSRGNYLGPYIKHYRTMEPGTRNPRIEALGKTRARGVEGFPALTLETQMHINLIGFSRKASTRIF